MYKTSQKCFTNSIRIIKKIVWQAIKVQGKLLSVDWNNEAGLKEAAALSALSALCSFSSLPGMSFEPSSIQRRFLSGRCSDRRLHSYVMTMLLNFLPFLGRESFQVAWKSVGICRSSIGWLSSLPPLSLAAERDSVDMQSSTVVIETVQSLSENHTEIDMPMFSVRQWFALIQDRNQFIIRGV